MQKIPTYIGASLLTIVLLFGGGFLTGRFTANKQPSPISPDYSSQISRIVELTKGFLITRQKELAGRERLLTQREGIISARETRATERERLIREAEERAASNGEDLTELEQILSRIVNLSETK